MTHIAIDARIIRSGTGRYIEQLLTHLEKLDSSHEFSVLVRKDSEHYWKPSNPNFKVVVADFADYSFAEQIGYYFFLKKLNADLVHFCMPQQPLFYRGPAVTSILDLTLLRINGNDMNFVELAVKKMVFSRLLKTVARRSKRILTISNYSKKDIIEFAKIKADKVTVAYLAATRLSSRFRPIKDFVGKDFIMYVGRAETYKNNRGLIHAHQKLLSEYPRLRLLVVGKKDSLRQDDMEWVKSNGYKNVDFVGFVSDSELAWLYANCRAYVFPSFMEGFGLPGLEAMLHGAPVVSSNATCLPEVYGDAAVYFNPADTDDMAQKIQLVMDDENVRDRLKKKGNEQVKKYSWEKMAKQTLELYNEVLTKVLEK